MRILYCFLIVIFSTFSWSSENELSLKCEWYGSLQSDGNYVDTTGELYINVASIEENSFVFTTSDDEFYFGELTSSELNAASAYSIQGKKVKRKIVINRFSGEIMQSLVIGDSKPLIHYGKCKTRIF